MKTQITRRGFLMSTAATAAVVASGPVAFGRSAAPDEYIDYDAIGMAELIKKGEISRTEAVEIVIRRIEALEPIINAVNTRTFDRALKKAETIPKDSTFAGMPILIKDMIDVGGVRRTDGSRMMLSNVPAKNVPYIDGVEAAGMNIVGMTNVPEFAQLGIVTNNTAFGLSRNPWNLSKSTLGSSGGAAAAVGAGMVPMAHGTDGGGSNRLPASAQGVFGMKPSRGRMLPGESGGKHGPFKTNQAISRTVRDSAHLFVHTEDRKGPFPPVGLVSGPSTKRLRIGYAAQLRGGREVEPGVRAAQEKTVQLLTELGHQVVEAEIPVRADEFFANYNGAFLGQFGFVTNSARRLAGTDPRHSGLIDPFTASLIEYGARIPKEVQEKGIEYIKKVPGFFRKLFTTVDILLSPVMPFVSLEGDILTPKSTVNDSTLALVQDGLSYTASINVSGHPAMSVPLNWDPDSGMPVGSMFQAALGADGLLYELAYELERARPWKNKWAPYSAKFIPV